ncbi:MAG: hypothetical protein EOS38_28595 [Mesorhizobium sp.]|nr:hypothetical protein EOA38_04510 [Mesorhizobium sp. M1E.F.Ca.ET.041.01.1.1]RWD80958.1 MAG: hypothetical protein EOS39_31450 [Mesorhizobium sp.]RWD81467.1 MAG: hypothetical protein EOS38_28595 [Mesorhizobium sp.]
MTSDFCSRAYPSGVCAAPHLPAGILSPYSDGEREALGRFRQSPAVQEGRRGRGQPLLPVTIRGEVPGRAMRGGADAGEKSALTHIVCPLT